MLNQAIIKTKEQILKKQREVAQLHAELELLNSRLKEQERLVEEFREAKEAMERAAQALVDSQEFSYEDVMEECKEIVVEEVVMRPVRVESNKATQLRTDNAKHPTKTSLTSKFNASEAKFKELEKKLDNKELNKQEVAKAVLKELDGLVAATRASTPK